MSLRVVAFIVVDLLLLAGIAAGGVPDAAVLGVPIYPGAKYEQVMSDRFTRASQPGTVYAVFVTPDAIEKVAGFSRSKLTKPGDYMRFDLAEQGLPVMLAQYGPVFPQSQDPQIKAANMKLSNLLNASANKSGKATLWTGTAGGREVSVIIQQPRLTIQADLVNETIIFIHSRKAD